MALEKERQPRLVPAGLQANPGEGAGSLREAGAGVEGTGQPRAL